MSHQGWRVTDIPRDARVSEREHAQSTTPIVVMVVVCIAVSSLAGTATRAAARGGALSERSESVQAMQAASLLRGRASLAELFHRSDSMAGESAGVIRTLEPESERRAGSSWRSPTIGSVSSRFQQRRVHPILRRARPHYGVDISAPWGAPILAPAPGVVVSVAFEVGYGLVAVIDHGSGVLSRYAHLAQAVVRTGQYVETDQPVAFVGDTGLSTGPHLHYEVTVNGRRVDPMDYLW